VIKTIKKYKNLIRNYDTRTSRFIAPAIEEVS